MVDTNQLEDQKFDAQSFILSSIGAFLRIRESGAPEHLKADIDALIAEGKDSLLEPQDDGSPWDEPAILRWYDENRANNAGLRERHGADGTGQP